MKAIGYLKFLFACASMVAITSATPANAAIPEKLCEMLKTANSGQFTPEEVCKAHGGTFCTSMEMGEAICRAGGGGICSNMSLPEAICTVGGGSFCTQVKSELQAVCEINRGLFCGNPDPKDKLKYLKQLAECKRF